MTKSGISLSVAGIALIVIGTVVSPVLHQPSIAIQTDETAWQAVDGLITASGAILLLAGLVLGLLGLGAVRHHNLPKADKKPVRSSIKRPIAMPAISIEPDRGYDLLGSTLSVIGMTALTLTLVAMILFRQA